MPPLLDRYTAYSAVGGALVGAKQYSPVAALGITVALEAFETYRQREAGVAPPANDTERHVANVCVAMVAWWLASKAVR